VDDARHVSLSELDAPPELKFVRHYGDSSA